MFKQIFCLFLFLSFSIFAHAADPNPEADFQFFNYENECRNCALTKKIFSKETLLTATHVNASLDFTYLIETKWIGMNLQGASFHDIIGDRIYFENCNLRGVNLSRSDLPWMVMDPSNNVELVNFSGSGLEYSIFSGVKLDRPYLDHAVLMEADFSNVNITEGRFNSSKLQEANFSGAVLKNCDFTDAKLKDVDFSGADLTGSIISAEQLASVKSVCEAILPDGTRGKC